MPAASSVPPSARPPVPPSARPSVPPSARPPVVLLTRDDALADRLATLAAVAGATLARDAGPWGPTSRGRPPLLLVGADVLDPAARAHPGDLRGGADRGTVVVVAPGAPAADLWRVSVEVGADHVVVLPEGEPWLLDRLLDVASGPPRGRVVGVVGGRGGAGASTLAVTLALAGARRRLQTLLVDADPLGGGVELLLGAEGLPGLRWSDVAGLRGRLQPGLLTGACAVADGVRLLPWDDPPGGVGDGDGGDGGYGVPAAAMTAVLDAATREADVVVVDLPRAVGPAEAAALAACHRVLLVVPAEVRAAAAAARIAGPVADLTADLRLVVRGPAPSGLPARAVADLLGLPLDAALPPEPGLAAVLDRGEAAAVRPRGALGRFAARVVDELAADLAATDRAADRAAGRAADGAAGRAAGRAS